MLTRRFQRVDSRRDCRVLTLQAICREKLFDSKAKNKIFNIPYLWDANSDFPWLNNKHCLHIHINFNASS